MDNQQSEIVNTTMICDPWPSHDFWCLLKTHWCTHVVQLVCCFQSRDSRSDVSVFFFTIFLYLLALTNKSKTKLFLSVFVCLLTLLTFTPFKKIKIQHVLPQSWSTYFCSITFTLETPFDISEFILIIKLSGDEDTGGQRSHRLRFSG